MRYIDKRRYHLECVAINRRFLRDCYLEDVSNPFPRPDDTDASFEDFKKPEYRKGENGWEEVLLKEQGYRCCYCMRRLDSEREGLISFEHIIPRSVSSGEEFNYYQQQSPVLSDYVIASDVFSIASLGILDSLEKMPHITALTNLMVSCNGKRGKPVIDEKHRSGCCCNNSRGNNRMMPIQLMEGASNSVSYDRFGILMISDQDGTLDSIVEDLNDDTLKEIRSVWYHLSFSDKREEDIIGMDLWQRIDLMKEVYHQEDYTSIPEEIRRYIGDVSSESGSFHWELFKDYGWFLDYYRSIR